MLKTVFGDINITINGQSFKYIPIKLDNKGKNYIVDGRYKVIVDNIKATGLETIIDCVLDEKGTSNLSSCPESGECLALISFMSENIKLSIGVEGDISGVYYEYMRDRLRVKISKDASLNRLTFFVAWVTMNNKEQEEIYTWFAADPTIEA